MFISFLSKILDLCTASSYRQLSTTTPPALLKLSRHMAQSVKVPNCPCTKMSKVVKKLINSPHIYKPVGPYNQAVLAGNTLYVSGVLGMDQSAKLVEGGAAAQARQCLENLKHVLTAGGASLPSVLKTTILLNSIDDFKDVNEIYAEFFPRDFPARATFQVGRLPLGAAVEIEAIALSGDLVIQDGSATA